MKTFGRVGLALVLCLSLLLSSCKQVTEAITETIDFEQIAIETVEKNLQAKTLSDSAAVLGAKQIAEDQGQTLRGFLMTLNSNIPEEDENEFAKIASLTEENTTIVFFLFNQEDAEINTALFIGIVKKYYQTFLNNSQQVKFIGLGSGDEKIISYDIKKTSLFYPYFTTGLVYFENDAEIPAKAPSAYRDAYDKIIRMDESLRLPTSYDVTRSTVTVFSEDILDDGTVITLGHLEIDDIKVLITLHKFQHDTGLPRLKDVDGYFERIFLAAYSEWTAQADYMGVGINMLFDEYGYRLMMP